MSDDIIIKVPTFTMCVRCKDTYCLVSDESVERNPESCKYKSNGIFLVKNEI